MRYARSVAPFDTVMRALVGCSPPAAPLLEKCPDDTVSSNAEVSIGWKFPRDVNGSFGDVGAPATEGDCLSPLPHSRRCNFQPAHRSLRSLVLVRFATVNGGVQIRGCRPVAQAQFRPF